MNAAYRQLFIFQQLLTGQLVQKGTLVRKFDVDPRVIQRDFSQIRQFITDQQLFYTMQYSRQRGGYTLATTQDSVSKQAILLIIKILLASRSLTTTEMQTTVNGLLALTPPRDQEAIRPIIKNETFHYVPLHHQQPLLQTIWQFSQFIIKKQTVTMEYQRQHGDYKRYTILPAAVIFSEYYFYVIAYSAEGHGNRFFRADRIRNYHETSTTIVRSRGERVEDGNLRQYVHYMQPGPKVELSFEFSGIVEAALDRFPKATVTARHPEQDSVTIKATASIAGAKMWLLSQGAKVKVLTPPSLVKTMADEIRAMAQQYE
ncbi:hypothetical protein LFAB_06320 [Lactiplantibacillus fabifermentans T30PCM01]|uniref:WYL domain-containing protein n=1 Tax=Lactiplantibacillus fabifermentans T30PCM01 TaxID=1400520 RepID=W6T856_9LACO|nr:WYL domain-containing protein [Lactiplantibacillus fabifermentans]ETY74601.1 hypothetical protein LFAB_06320 [Lactiplantibacillus fabifermentans T30PCM01]